MPALDNESSRCVNSEFTGNAAIALSLDIRRPLCLCVCLYGTMFGIYCNHFFLYTFFSNWTLPHRREKKWAKRTREKKYFLDFYTFSVIYIFYVLFFCSRSPEQAARPLWAIRKRARCRCEFCWSEECPKWQPGNCASLSLCVCIVSRVEER